ncbi:MAG: hypothetical protein WC582_00230 [Patescibacteria group bacterium]
MSKTNSDKENNQSKNDLNDNGEEQKSITQWQTSLSKQFKIILIFFLFVALILVISNYHIVLDATDLTKPIIFIERPYWGFSDMISSVKTCTEAPRYSVMINHPSLCKALQNAGYLESEEAGIKRIEAETMQKLQLYKLLQ